MRRGGTSDRVRCSVVLFAVVGAACQGDILGPASPTTTGPPTPTDSAPVPNDIGQRPEPSTCALPKSRLAKLTPSQLARTLEELFGEPMEGVESRVGGTVAASGRFSNASTSFAMTTPHVEALFELSRDVAARVQSSPASLDPCLGTELGTETCTRSFVGTFGERAFRRPLSASEVDEWATVFETEAAVSSAEQALDVTVRAMLLSPHFLYRTELGVESATGDRSLTSHERASALSYYLTDAPPDSALLEAAAAGTLETAEQIESQVRRLLADSSSLHGLRTWIRELYHTDSVLEVDKDETRFPDFNSDIAEAMKEETEDFVFHVLFEDDSRLATLLSADFTVASPSLASFYGLGSPDSAGRVAFGDHRAGLLSHGSFLATYATFTDSHIIGRGHFVREEVLCGTIPPPPPEVTDEFPAPREGETQRAFLEDRHSSDSSCFGCHRLMDSLGFALESFDAVGRYRERDDVAPIDASGVLYATSLPETAFDGPVELASLLAQTDEAHQCMIKRATEYGAGRTLTSEDACLLFDLNEAFDATDGDIVELLVTLTTHPSFFERAQ